MLILPPKKPVNGEKSYFQILCEEASKYVKDIPLDFTGYESLVDAYVASSDNDNDTNYELSKAFNAWFEYFSEIANVIQNKFLDAETDKLKTVSEKSILHSEKNVSAGDRKANTDSEVIVARKRRNTLKSLYDALVARQDFCEKAFYQCKHNCLNQMDLPLQNRQQSGGMRNGSAGYYNNQQ